MGISFDTLDNLFCDKCGFVTAINAFPSLTLYGFINILSYHFLRLNKKARTKYHENIITKISRMIDILYVFSFSLHVFWTRNLEICLDVNA